MSTPTAPPNLVVVFGPEPLLVSRAISAVVARVRAAEAAQQVPDDQRAVVVRLDAADVEDAGLDELLSPSLFGERRVLIINGVQDLPEAMVAQLRSHLGGLADDVTLVLVHKGGVQNRALIDAAGRAGAERLSAAKVTFDSDKVALVMQCARAARREITPEAVRALVDALGQDVAELVAGVDQLITIASGPIDADLVRVFHGDRIESTGFSVADAAVAGDGAGALRLLRNGLDRGLVPVFVTSALAGSLRAIARVAAAPRGLRKDDLVRDLGISPYAVDKARRVLPGWSPEGLVRAMHAVAHADAEVKGAGADPGYALERVVLEVAEAHNPR